MPHLGARTRVLRSVRAFALLAAITSGAAGLRWLGLPDVGWADLTAWLEATAPEDVVVALVHLTALVAAGYLLASSAIYVLASASGSGALTSAAARVTPAAIRRGVDGLLAATIVALPISIASPAMAGPAQGNPTPVYVPTPAGDPTPAPEVPDLQTAPLSAPEMLYVVTEGDSLWSIAETTVESIDPNASGSRVADYWRRLIEANISALQSGDPNVIFPGEVLALPPVG